MLSVVPAIVPVTEVTGLSISHVLVDPEMDWLALTFVLNGSPMP